MFNSKTVSTRKKILEYGGATILAGTLATAAYIYTDYKRFAESPAGIQLEEIRRDRELSDKAYMMRREFIPEFIDLRQLREVDAFKYMKKRFDRSKSDPVYIRMLQNFYLSIDKILKSDASPEMALLLDYYILRAQLLDVTTLHKKPRVEEMLKTIQRKSDLFPRNPEIRERLIFELKESYEIYQYQHKEFFKNQTHPSLPY